jgi:flagellar motor component MotA
MGILFGILGVGVVIGAMSMGGEVRLYMDVPSVAYVFGGTIFFSCAYQSPGSIASAFKTAVGRDPLSEQDARFHIGVLSSVRVIASASGVLGSLIGLVSMLANMDDPKSIGPAMAVALLTLFYAVIIAELFIGPLIGRLRNRATADLDSADPPIKVTPVTLVAIPISLLAFFVILNSF